MIDDLAEWIDNTFNKYRNMPTQCGLARDDGMVSEAEASDSGIMFVSKRRESPGTGSPGQESGRSRAGSPRAEEGQKQGGGSRIAGQTITEMELVRRRRLQDSHLFD